MLKFWVKTVGHRCPKTDEAIGTEPARGATLRRTVTGLLWDAVLIYDVMAGGPALGYIQKVHHVATSSDAESIRFEIIP